VDPFFPKSTAQQDRSVTLETELSGITATAAATFRSDGAVGRDDHDALQLQRPGTSDDLLGGASLLELYSVLDDGTGLDINNIPYNLDSKTTIPVEPMLRGCDGSDPYVGEATISLQGARNIPASWGLALKDTKTGEQIALRDTTQSEYTYTLESSTPASTCESLSTSSKSAASAQTTPGPPSPEVVTHPVSKEAGTPNTRFQLVIRPNSALPVELTDFNAEIDQQTAVLNWATASERNNAGFYVQRETKSGSFTTLDGSFVEGAGTASSTNEYSYRVEDLDAGTHTFRLKQVDQEGSASFSDPVDVKIGLDSQFKLSTYPNPVRAQATVEFAIKESADVTLALYNTLGQKVRTVYRGTPPAEETKRVPVETQNLSSGVYFLRLEGEGVTGTQRMTVVK
jgi:hypothetical protein